LGDSMEVGILDSVLLSLTETERDYDYAYASS
jgi:hypothetical protein